MNSFLINSSEIIDSIVTLNNERAAVFQLRYGFKPGLAKVNRICTVGSELKLGLRDKCRAIGKVIKSQKDEVKLEIIWKGDAPKRVDMTLVVGMCRPQTVKKVVGLCASFGVSKLVFVETELGEKGYRDSTVWEDGSIAREIDLALEQVWDVTGCDAVLGGKIKNYLETVVGNIFVADTTDTVQKISSLDFQKSAVIFGPEAGFSSDERSFFNSLKCIPFYMGERIFRVEHAVGALLGKALGR